MGAQAGFCPGHRGRWGYALRAQVPPVTAACPARPSRASGSGVLAASAVAWLLLWAAGLVGRLAADISDAPFSAGKGQGAEVGSIRGAWGTRVQRRLATKAACALSCLICAGCSIPGFRAWLCLPEAGLATL